MSEKLQQLQSERREEIIHAAWRVVADGGLSGLTIRSIAKELGCTTGVLMHYYTGKEAILEEMIDRLYRSIQSLSRISVDGAEPADRLERMLLACLPLESATQFGWKLAVVMQAEVLRSAAIAQLHSKHHDTMQAALRQELESLADQKRLRENVNVELAAARLMALIEGIGTHAVLRPNAMSEQLQVDLLREELANLKV